MKAAFRNNWKHYLQEALGLAIFMISACFFSAMIFSEKSACYTFIPGEMMKNIVMGVLMGLTALFIFYSPFTAPSGSQINPAVTLVFLRLNKMCRYDALFFFISQCAGGVLAVYLMQWGMGSILISPPVNSAVTVPGKFGAGWALLMEWIISFNKKIYFSRCQHTGNGNKNINPESCPGSRWQGGSKASRRVHTKATDWASDDHPATNQYSGKKPGISFC